MNITNPNTPKLRVGLLLCSPAIPAWAYAMLENIKQGNTAEVVLLATFPSSSANAHNSDFSTWLYQRYDRFERSIVKLQYDPFEEMQVQELFPELNIMQLVAEKSSGQTRVSENDLNMIRQHELDVLFDITDETLDIDIASVANYGVWSYLHSDYGTNRNPPAGFWEVVEGHSVTGITLLQSAADGQKQVIATSYSPTDTPFTYRNRYKYDWKSAKIFPRELERLANLGEDAYFTFIKKRNKSLGFYDRKTHSIPNNREFLSIYSTYLLRYVWKKLFRLFSKPQWFLLFEMSTSATMSTDVSQFQALLPPKDRFWADPHIIYHEGKYYIFIEELQFKDNRGYIALIEMDEAGNYKAARTILERPYHLSYPFVFKYKNDFYMIPETAQNRTIEVYKARKFPDEWEHFTDIMRNVEAYDTTLLFYNSKWWLFTVLQEVIVGSSCDDLFLFFSDDPFSGEWQAHPQNPIVSDARRARPAGALFEHNNRLYRPSQDDSQSYGYGIRINRIITLTETEYDEEEVDFVEPLWDKRIKGLHTFNHQERLTIIDAVRRVSKL